MGGTFLEPHDPKADAPKAFAAGEIRQVSSTVHLALDSLRKSGYTLVLASAGSRNVIVPSVRKFGLEKYFDVIATTDDMPKGWKDPKDKRYAIYKAQRILGAKPEDMVMITDDAQEIKYMMPAGMRGAVNVPKGSEFKSLEAQLSEFTLATSAARLFFGEGIAKTKETEAIAVQDASGKSVGSLSQFGKGVQEYGKMRVPAQALWGKVVAPPRISVKGFHAMVHAKRVSALDFYRNVLSKRKKK